MASLPRRTGRASIATLAAVTLVAVVVQLAAPGWTRAAGLDVWNYPSASAELDTACAQAVELDASSDGLARVMAASEAVADRLIAGRITLAAAVDELDFINRERDGFAAMLSYAYPDVSTHRDRLTRYAVVKVRTRLSNDPARLRDVTARIDAEARALAAAHAN